MAFIPIDAKADVSESKKGKLTPAQHAQINALCFYAKTGIFDCLNRCTTTALSYTASSNIANIVFNSGYLTVCGRFVECEQGTTFQMTTPASGTETGWVILRFNLGASGESEFEIAQKSSAENLVQQDLNNNPSTGVYEFVLYNYTAYPDHVDLIRNNTFYLPSSEVAFVSKPILTISDLLDENKNRFIVFRADVTINNVTIPMYSIGTLSGMRDSDRAIDVIDLSGNHYVGFYNSNGTWTIRKADYDSINQRLEALGFKSGSVSNFVGGTTLKKQAKYAILTIPEFEIPPNQSLKYTGTISFTAKGTVHFSMGGIGRYGSGPVYAFGTIFGNTITLDTSNAESYSTIIYGTQIGFEIINW